MGFLKSLFSFGGMNNAVIDRAIEHLGQEGSVIGTAYRELSYNDVINYIRSNNCRITTSIENPHNGWTEFERVLSGQRYQITLCRAHDGVGSVLTSKKM